MPGLPLPAVHRRCLRVRVNPAGTAATLLVFLALIAGPTKVDGAAPQTFWMGDYQPVPFGAAWVYRNEYPPSQIVSRSVFEKLVYEGHPAVKFGGPDDYQIVGNTACVYTIYASADYGIPDDLPQDVVLGQVADGNTFTACAVAPCDTNLIRDWDAIDPALRTPFGLDATYNDLILVAVYDRGYPPNPMNPVVESNLPAGATRPTGAVTQMMWCQRWVGAVAVSDVRAAYGTMDDFFKLTSVSGVDDRSSPPVMLTLEQNTPNPFNPKTTIVYTVPRGGGVSIKIFNVRGELVRTLVEQHITTPGTFRVDWDGANDTGHQAASGVYICCLEAGESRETRRMTLVK